MAGWAVQQARQFAWSLCERPTPARFLIHDRDSKFSRVFDEVFRSDGVEIIRTPFRAPQANAFAERWVGTVRRDCLDWILIVSRRQLEQVLRVYVDHYNRHRPHRALGLTPPTPEWRLRRVSSHAPDHLHRRDRLGGLVPSAYAASQARGSASFALQRHHKNNTAPKASDEDTNRRVLSRSSFATRSW
jgi:putative transposase